MAFLTMTTKAYTMTLQDHLNPYQALACHIIKQCVYSLLFTCKFLKTRPVPSYFPFDIHTNSDS